MVALSKQGCLAICLIGLALIGGTSVRAQSSPRKFERVLIEVSKPYDATAASVRAMGGRVTQQYKYVDAIAAEIPVDALDAVRSQIGSLPMYKDVLVTLPQSAGPGLRVQPGTSYRVYAGTGGRGNAIPASAIPAFASNHPGAYLLNFEGSRLDKVHARGYTGAGTLVAVIDSGIRPGFSGLNGSIVGGEDFVGDGNGYSNSNNDPHGTFVAGLISNNATFQLSGLLRDAVAAYAPAALDPGDSLTLLGSAPQSKLYALRVFGSNAGAGAHVSIVLAAMQRVIELRVAHNQGAPGGLKIDVCNMSVGVTTLNPGRSLLDKSADAMLAAGIIPVTSAGDAGMSALTISSPGSSKSTLTVGSTSPAANDRIGWDVFYQTFGYGPFFRPFDGMQTASFSSRGPNADGRPAPDVVAIGVSNFSQGYCPASDPCPNDVSLNSGTSFSTPVAAGMAAVLRQAFPHASAIEIRNALAMTGRPGLIQDGSEPIDRGTGVIDAFGAYKMLASGDAPNRLPQYPRPSSDVRQNVERNTDLRVYSRNVTKIIRNLLPGERYDLLFDVAPNTAALSVNVTNITPELPFEDQNFFYGDGLIVAIHSAKTSQIGAFGDYLVREYPRTDTVFSVTDPDTGLLRISIVGDTLNAGKVSTKVTVAETIERLPRVSFRGRVQDGDFDAIPFTVPGGTNQAEFLLSWGDDWSHFPTADIDLILVSPSGEVNTQGVSLAGPERVTLTNPEGGAWTAYVDGFNIPAGADTYKLRVLLDGVVVH